jgi:hypothetical protein
LSREAAAYWMPRMKRGMTGEQETHPRILAAPRARAFAKILSRQSRGRREGRVPARTHGPRATKKHAAEPQVWPIIRPSLRDGFTAYT